MDIGNISSMYSDIYSSASGQAAGKLENQLAGDYSKATDEELMDACKQFEAYFVEQMYKGMLKTIPKNEEGSGSTSSMLDYYKDRMVQELSADTAENSSLGLAQMLYE
ncbi:MAG: rod-binding protein, partial [Lachnospiraceae bacterium]|nr:rod-binding protein [Lachnospiraceae bacterium]